ncbi:type I 3-dehydroquinate dehydratase [Hutsoniella sourekii]
MNTVTVGNCTFGEGQPKIIVPIVATNKADVLDEVKNADQVNCDLIEWRIDHFDQVLEEGAVASLSKEIKSQTQLPLLITFRSKREGGVKELSDDGYVNLYHQIIEDGQFDLIDIELFMSGDVMSLIKAAKDKGIKVIMCNHDFDATPAEAEIIHRLTEMEDKGADICKIAVMPNNSDDVLTLLSATNKRYKEANTPLITMSMGQLGMISRVSGEIFGSSASFGTVNEASAPGQLPVSSLKKIQNDLSLN